MPPSDWRCSHCHKPLLSPNELCSGSFANRDHPTNCPAEPVPSEPAPDPPSPTCPDCGGTRERPARFFGRPCATPFHGAEQEGETLDQHAMMALLQAANDVRGGIPNWLKGAPSHVLAELLNAIEARGWRLVPLNVDYSPSELCPYCSDNPRSVILRPLPGPDPSLQALEERGERLEVWRDGDEHWYVRGPGGDVPFLTAHEHAAVGEVLQGIVDLGGEGEHATAPEVEQLRAELDAERKRAEELTTALMELHRMAPLYDSSGRKVAWVEPDTDQVAEGLRIGDRIIRSILGEQA